jgi:hypothetical protein
MGPRQHANWCVTLPISDWVMGTREPWVGTEAELRSRAGRKGRDAATAVTATGATSATGASTATSTAAPDGVTAGAAG